MKTPLQQQLAKLAPSIVIETIWTRDPDAYSSWESEIRATAIQCGEMVSGSAYLSGTWEIGSEPAKSNPDVSGYEPQMTREALVELLSCIPILDRDARIQIHKAIDRLDRTMNTTYATQQLATA